MRQISDTDLVASYILAYIQVPAVVSHCLSPSFRRLATAFHRAVPRVRRAKPWLIIHAPAQRDDVQVVWTGLHHLFGAAGAEGEVMALRQPQRQERTSVRAAPASQPATLTPASQPARLPPAQPTDRAAGLSPQSPAAAATAAVGPPTGLAALPTAACSTLHTPAHSPHSPRLTEALKGTERH